jgi:hypothetical protein
MPARQTRARPLLWSRDKRPSPGEPVHLSRAPEPGVHMYSPGPSSAPEPVPSGPCTLVQMYHPCNSEELVYIVQGVGGPIVLSLSGFTETSKKN